MSKTNSERPFKDLGTRLKSLRVRLQETISDVSGAVEINSDLLLRIEEGFVKPTEDILLLLMSHLSVQEEEASKLWELAGYNTDSFDSSQTGQDLTAGAPQVYMVMQQDTRIQYTDMVNVTVNDYGVVMNFMQKMGGQGQPQLISRMGMSKEHAKSIITVLQTTLDQASRPQKSLPAQADSTKTHQD